MAVVRIDDVAVSFARRDVRYITHRERLLLEDLVRAEQEAEGCGRLVEEIVIETDYLDKDLVRFRTTVRVLSERMADEASG